MSWGRLHDHKHFASAFAIFCSGDESFQVATVNGMPEKLWFAKLRKMAQTIAQFRPKLDALTLQLSFSKCAI